MPKWRCVACGVLSYGWCGYHEYLQGQKMHCLYCGGEREPVEPSLRPAVSSPRTPGNGKEEILLMVPGCLVSN